MPFEFSSSYTGSFFNSREFPSADTYLTGSGLRVRGGVTYLTGSGLNMRGTVPLDRVISKLFKYYLSAKNAVTAAIWGKSVIPTPLQDSSDVAQIIKKIVNNLLPSFVPPKPPLVIQPILPATPVVVPPMTPVPYIRPPFPALAVQPSLHVHPSVVAPVPTLPPMSPNPSIQPHFPNPVAQPHPIPSPIIHVNPHLQGSNPVPTSFPTDPVPISADPIFDAIPTDPVPPGGNPPPADPVPPGSLAKLAALLPIISKLGGPILSLIPPLLYAFYNSEEKILQNTNVNILATRTPKKYTVALGNKDGEEMSIDFEVVAGRFYRDEVIETNDGFAYAIFKAKSLLSYLPLVNKFEWKRKIHETDCNITIDDPGNLSLQNGPISVYYPLSENEGFNIIYRDPTANTALTAALFNHRTHDYHLNAEDAEYTSFNVADMKVVGLLGRYEKERTQLASLPFDDDPKKAHDYYLKVTQYNPDK